MYESMIKTQGQFQLFVIALDEHVSKAFPRDAYPFLEFIAVEELEAHYSELKTLKENRDTVSYVFTLSPYYPHYLLTTRPELPHICTLDADQYFFSDTSFLFKDLDRFSILITPHRFSEHMKAEGAEEYGKFNVSFQIFKNDVAGRSCLSYWKDQCTAWCKDELDGDKFADQKYLDTWGEKYEKELKVIDHIGMGLAPWNLDSYTITYRRGRFFVDDQDLVLYHYQGLRLLEDNFVYTAYDRYHASISSGIIKLIALLVTGLKKEERIGKDTIGRHQKVLNLDSISPASFSSYFKLFKGKLLTFEQYLTIKKISSGALAKVKNAFRNQRKSNGN